VTTALTTTDQQSLPAVRREQPFRETRTIKLTEEQQAILTAPIPPHEIGITGDGKLHYPHTTITNRFNAAFGVAQWRLENTDLKGQANPQVVRTEAKQKNMEEIGEKIEVILFQDFIVQGIIVASVQDSAEYFSWNKDGKYSNALASAKSKCLYECAKALGVGQEIKDPEYCEDWKKTFGVYAVDKKWKKKTGNSATIDQIRRLSTALRVSDFILLHRCLSALVNKVPSGAEMEELLKDLSRRQQIRELPVTQLSFEDAESLKSKWLTAGITAQKLDYIFGLGLSIRETENQLVLEAEELKRKTAAPVEDLYTQPPPPPEEPKKSEQPEIDPDEIPADAPGLMKAGTKAYAEYPASMLEKWYGEKQDKPQMQERYHSAMAIKLARLTGEGYGELIATNFTDLCRRYEEAKK